MTSPDNTALPVGTPSKEAVSTTRHVRRRLVTGAGAGFMVLGSRSVLGKECYNPSETLSGARSHTGGELPQCNGDSPGVWGQAVNGEGARGTVSWYSLNPPLPVSPPWDTPFHDLFPGSSYRGRTLGEVLNARGHADPDRLGKHMVGALLNIRAGLVDPRAMTEDYLVNTIWPEGPNNMNSPFGANSGAIKDFLLNTGIIK